MVRRTDHRHFRFAALLYYFFSLVGALEPGLLSQYACARRADKKHNGPTCNNAFKYIYIFYIPLLTMTSLDVFFYCCCCQKINLSSALISSFTMFLSVVDAFIFCTRELTLRLLSSHFQFLGTLEFILYGCRHRAQPMPSRAVLFFFKFLLRAYDFFMVTSDRIGSLPFVSRRGTKSSVT